MVVAEVRRQAMFARIKKTGRYEYLQIVENRKVNGKTRQRVIASLGRVDRLQEKDRIDSLIRSLSRFSEKTLLVLSGRGDVMATANAIGPDLLFGRLWRDLGLPDILEGLLRKRRFGFPMERAIYLAVLHRLFVSGSDRSCDRWRRDLLVSGTEDLAWRHFYRAMGFLGEALEEQEEENLPGGPRRIKDLIEEQLFARRRDLFSNLRLVFFDTTSIYFEGEGGGPDLGRFGHTKDKRPDRKQMVVGVVVDEHGMPLCCEMFPGNTADVSLLAPLAKRLRRRFAIQELCIVADRGMISKRTIEALESADPPLYYILGVRMRQVTEVSKEVLSRAGRYRVVRSGSPTEDRDPLEVKEVRVGDRRYIVCRNAKQARKDAAAREAIIAKLETALRRGGKSLIGNRGYARYLKPGKEMIVIDRQRVAEEARYDGKWVLRTNTSLPADQVALKYKELWRIEQIFRDMKSVLETRPVYHRTPEAILGHVFTSFLALTLRNELDRRLAAAGHEFEWSNITQDLMALQEVKIEESGKRLAVRTAAQGVCGKLFRAVGVALPPTIREC
jgi:transposase